MSVDISSTKSRVKDIAAVGDVLDAYETEGVDFLLDEEGNLKVALEKVEEDDAYGEEMPRALKLDELPNREKFTDEDSFWDAYNEAFDEKGDKGFLALLRELAPSLVTPLMILALEVESNDGFAHVWRVEPGATELETLDVAVL